MTLFIIGLDIRNLDGTLVLALENEAGGFWVRRGGMPAGGRGSDERWLTAPWADGAGLQGSTVPMNDETLLVKVFGPDWVSVETRFEALMDATRQSAWLLRETRQGVSRTWRAGPITVTPAPVEPIDMLNNRRFVQLGFKTQPSYTISGI